MLGLYYDDAAKDKQEIIRAVPYNLKPVYGLSQASTELLAKKSVFLQPEVLKHIVQLLISDKSQADLRV